MLNKATDHNIKLYSIIKLTSCVEEGIMNDEMNYSDSGETVTSVSETSKSAASD